MPLTDKEAKHVMSSCRHFNGIQNDCCEAGVSFNQFTGSLPCLKFTDKGTFTCDKRQFHTREEVEDEHAAMEAYIALLQRVQPVVSECKAITRSGGVSSFSRVYPVCGAALRIEVARINLHARVHCATDGCARWIE